jgi:polar amino acid transport system substrate-binding protein
MVGDRNSLQYQIAQAGLEDKYVIYSNYVGTVRYNILVSKGETALLRMLNEGLAQLRASGRYDELNIKWIYDSEGYQVRQTVRKILYISAVVFVIVSIYIISETRVRRLLKQEVKAKTQALRASNEELAQRIRQIETEGELRDLLVQNSPSSLILFDESGRVVLVNSSTLRLLGLDALPEQADVTDFPIFKELLQHQSDAGENNTPLKYTLCQPGAEKRTFRYNVHLLTARGQNGRRLLSIDDVTAEEEQKQALFEREKSLALSRMVAGIAHEIRNPLMSIRTFAWMAKTKLSDPQFLDAFSEFVPTEVDRINKLIESLINYARPTRGGQRTIILRDLVDESLYLVRAAAPGERISIQNEQAGSLSVYANPDQIKQVLINILMNSVESMEEKITAGAPPPLCMRITSNAENARFVTLSVSDQGVGMSEEVLHHCTDPFFTTKTKGTGLGLALSRQYLLENGGDLTIKSVPGKGTEVTLFIPAAPAASTDVHTDREVIL